MAIEFEVEKIEPGTLCEVPLEHITSDPNQPRKHFDEKALKELSDSIKSRGLIQPIVVRKAEGDDAKLTIVAGERRYRAVNMLKLGTIRCIVTDDDSVELSLIENIQRVDLNPFEEAEAYQRMIDDYDYNQEQLGKIVGKSRSTISHTLKINDIPADIKKKCIEQNLPKRVLIELANRKTQEEMDEITDKIKDGQLTSEDIRKQRKPRDPNAPAVEIANKKISDLTKSIKRLQKKEISADEKLKIQNEFFKLEAAIKEMVAFKD
jgi:ParB family chromosome partitioning protein